MISEQQIANEIAALCPKALVVADPAPCGHSVVFDGKAERHYPMSGGLSVPCGLKVVTKQYLRQMVFHRGDQYFRWVPSVWWKPWTWNRNWGRWGS